MAGDGRLQLLLKGRGPAAQGNFAFGPPGARIAFTSKPLFRSIGATGGGAAFVAAGPQWSLATVDATRETANAWDACHALLSDGQGAAAAGVEFAEPDLLQRWPVQSTSTGGALAAARQGVPHPQNSDDFPAIPGNNLWFRDPQHGQFSAVGLANPGSGVRIAHLDTGYDPDHRTRPVNLSASEQRNFVDEDAPNDARDRSSGPFNNFSHGTGTLSILAGAPIAPGQGFGCAPFAEVIPIRVADRVVLFRNSAIAQAFDYVHGLCRTPASRVHVVTMSMGGLPSQAWAEAINALYEAGVFVVTAAGNNYANLPSHFIVYPARFNRVIAACGAMADGTPYADLKPLLMAGDYGPPGKMDTAIAAYTPNVPWARFGEPEVVDFDGEGTSAATPQVAGAAALWIQKNRAAYDAYAEPWMRVEAVRSALFAGAAQDQARQQYFGRGRLRAKNAADSPPAQAGVLHRQPPDNAASSASHILFGLGLGTQSPRQAMIELELRQVLQANGLEQRLLEAETAKQKAEVIDQLLAVSRMSKPLREALGDRDASPVKAPAAGSDGIDSMIKLHVELALDPQIPQPPTRRLRVFAYDPSLQTDVTNFGINEAVVNVRWEHGLQPGPVGEYLEVIDIDPGSRCCYAPVDLNHPHVLAESGLPPSEANPQFHQQMVYAVAMRTIARFERALGRRALWAEHVLRQPDGEFLKSEYIRRLRIYPHALREENAYYSRERMALLFGYFNAQKEDAGMALPGSRVFCAVSHDIVAHETTHALLDGLHPRYQEATNPDMLAFHEAFADIVALFQHFTMPEALFHSIQQSSGDLKKDDLLGTLARQFGEASGMHGALRSFIGPPRASAYRLCRDAGEPHALGAVLVSAIFAAFETIYRARIADLIRLATNGTGILPAGQISHDLAGRLASEASKVADQVLNMCIRALDYCPPIDLNFGDYLRALITADHDVVPNDNRGYRVAVISAFRDRGIFPTTVRHLAEDSLLWETPPLPKDELDRFNELIGQLDLRWNLNTDRYTAYLTSKANAAKVWKWLTAQGTMLDAMGFEPAQSNVTLAGMTGSLHAIEVHSVRPCRRSAPDGTSQAMLVIEITQTFRADPDQVRYRGGCTLLVDLGSNQAKYIVRKRLRGESGAAAQKAERALAAERAADCGMRFVDPGDHTESMETFAMLHRAAPQKGLAPWAGGGDHDPTSANAAEVDIRFVDPGDRSERTETFGLRRVVREN